MGHSPAMTPQEYVQDKAAASGSSFYYAFLFLPKPRRAAITAFYAFCREVDDDVDEVSDPGLALQLTNVIRDVGEDALRGRIYLPVNELQQFVVKAHEILNRVHSDRFV